VITGQAMPLDRSDVDTDQIIPAHWLRRIERTGFSEGLFEAWRKDPAFVLNDARYKGAPILVAGANFGCGSSREHAPWALDEYGFRAVIAPSFADIFRQNSLKIGLVPAAIPASAVARLLAAAKADPALEVTVDVKRLRVVAPGAGVDEAFALDAFTQWRVLEGLDDIGLTERHADRIAAFERARPARLPRIA